MMINWKVRVKNPVFWVQMALAIGAPMLAGVGLQWEQVTDWPTLGRAIVAAVSSPTILLTMAVAAWGVINDPTTKGLSDGNVAMQYVAPSTMPETVTGKHVKDE